MNFKPLLLSIGFLLLVPQAFAENAELKADAQNINTACASDSTTASCGDQKVGSGLLKCLHAYKKANPSYHFTEGCKAAMKKGHEDRKAARANKS